MMKDEEDAEGISQSIDDTEQENGNIYVEHFKRIICSTRLHFSTLLLDSEIQWIERYMTLSVSAQVIYARLFQRKGPWFRTASLMAIVEKIAPCSSEDILQEALEELVACSFLRLGSNESKSFHETLEAMHNACTIPEIQTVMQSIGATTSKTNTRYKTKGEMLDRLRTFVSTQRRIDGSYVPLAKHLQQALQHDKKASILLFQMNTSIRNAFYRMHKLMYVTLTLPPRSAPLRIASWSDWQTLSISYDPVAWPGLLNTFGKISFQEVEYSTTCIFPSLAALVAYECVRMLRHAVGLLVDGMPIDTLPTAHEGLSLEWLDLGPPSLLVFSTSDIKSKEDCYTSVEQFLNGVENLDVFVTELRSCLHHTKSNFSHDKRVFLQPFHAGYGLARCLDNAISLYEKLGHYEKALILLQELLDLDDILLHKRGLWYTRLAINLELHMKQPNEALAVCNQALLDTKLFPTDRKAIIRRHLRLTKANTSEMNDIDRLPSVSIDGRPLNRAMGEKSRFIGYDDAGCTVEELVLQHYQMEGWFGTHHEGAQLRMLLGLLLWDVIFMDVADVFQTPFQDRPLDMDMRYGDHFYRTRASAINNTIMRLKDSSPSDLCEWLRTTWSAHEGKQCGLVYWDRFTLVYIQLMALGFGAMHIASLVEEWVKYLDTSGLPDLFMMRVSWNRATIEGIPLTEDGYLDIAQWCSSEDASIEILLNENSIEAQFVEVKGPRDRLSDTQIVWIERLNASHIKSLVCYVQEPTKPEKKIKAKRNVSKVLEDELLPPTRLNTRPTKGKRPKKQQPSTKEISTPSIVNNAQNPIEISD